MFRPTENMSCKDTTESSEQLNSSADHDGKESSCDLISAPARAEGSSPRRADDFKEAFSQTQPWFIHSRSYAFATGRLISWDDGDLSNPRNWSKWSKWSQIAMLLALTIITTMASSMFAPGVPELMHDFDSNSKVVAALVVSIYSLGLALGPLIIAPMSELYGRLPVYHVGTLGFIAFTIACSRAQSVGEMCAYRFLEGAFGCGPVTLGGAIITDLMDTDQRGVSMAIWSLGGLLGPVIGPIVGGFLIRIASWRWNFYGISIIAGAFGIASGLIVRETYAPILLERKVVRLRSETGNMHLRSELASFLTPTQLFKQAMVRPMKLLLLAPICTFMSMYTAVAYGYVYLLFTTFSFVFGTKYHFSPSSVGLTFLGIGLGCLIGLVLVGVLSDRLVKRSREKSPQGESCPEARLPPLIWVGPLMPLGFLWYGWTSHFQCHWMIPLLGTALIGIGIIAIMVCITTYLTDVYPRYSSSAIAANTILRSIFGAIVPLFGLNLYSALGLGWGNSLLAFVALALCPVPVLFYRHGKRIRGWRIVNL